MPELLLMHGPNLNLLGQREPGHYGTDKLEDINRRCQARAAAGRAKLVAFQSNAEHELIDRIHLAATEDVGFIIINPGGFTHTSVALRDALASVHLPFIEVHLSNIHAREPFRQVSYFSDLAAGVISGLGALGYELAVDAALARLSLAPD